MQMLSGGIIAIREGLEAALVIAVILGSLHKLERQDLIVPVWMGAIAAAITSVLLAVLLFKIGISLEGEAEKVFEGLVMILAAVILTWVIVWMQVQNKDMRGSISSSVRKASRQGGHFAVFSVAFLAIVREGVELALFTNASLISTDDLNTLLGVLFGLCAAFLLAWAIARGLLRMNIRSFFLFTSVLLVLFAAGLLAHGVHELNEAGWVPPVIPHVWDVNHILDENSNLGILLKSLFGYNGNPSLTEVIAYGSYLAIITAMLAFYQIRIREVSALSQKNDL